MEQPGTAVRNAVFQFALDRRGQSYRFSFDQVMRSLSSHALIVPGGAIIPLEITNPGHVSLTQHGV
jgi:hypothetical protein